MSETTEQKIPKGSYAAGRVVSLPADAEAPIVVYINGLVQTEGEDYNLRGGEILFTREIVKEELEFSRKLAMFLGLFGTYRKHETIDVQYQKDGKTELAADLTVRS